MRYQDKDVTITIHSIVPSTAQRLTHTKFGNYSKPKLESYAINFIVAAHSLHKTTFNKKAAPHFFPYYRKALISQYQNLRASFIIREVALYLERPLLNVTKTIETTDSLPDFNQFFTTLLG